MYKICKFIPATYDICDNHYLIMAEADNPVDACEHVKSIIMSGSCKLEAIKILEEIDYTAYINIKIKEVSTHAC